MQKKLTIRRLAITVLLMTLASCGGGGSSDSGSDNTGNSISAPADIEAIASNRSIKLTWPPVSDATVYDIYFARESFAGLSSLDDYATLLGGSVSRDVNSTGIIFGELINDTTYYFVITASDGVIVSPASNEVSATPDNLPRVAANFNAVAGYQKVDLSWDSAINADFYNIYYARESFANLNNINNYASLSGGALIASVGGPSYTVSSLTNGVPYYFILTSANSSAESAATTEQIATPFDPPSSKINDTGVTWGATNSGNTFSCNGMVIAAQDCSNGRDALNNDDSDGHAGFVFKKLDENGNELDATATDWSCVLDSHIGLVWEVKTDDDGLRDKDWLYTSYDSRFIDTDASDNEIDGGSDEVWGGLEDNGTNATSGGSDSCGKLDDICTTEQYVADVNAQGLCGASDWRLPKFDELLSIVDYSINNVIGPAIDSNYFPFSANNSSFAPTVYVSETPSVVAPDHVMSINFDWGSSWSTSRSAGRSIRLVRDNL